jgi:hypothetical protein
VTWGGDIWSTRLPMPADTVVLLAANKVVPARATGCEILVSITASLHCTNARHSTDLFVFLALYSYAPYVDHVTMEKLPVCSRESPS